MELISERNFLLNLGASAEEIAQFLPAGLDPLAPVVLVGEDALTSACAAACAGAGASVRQMTRRQFVDAADPVAGQRPPAVAVLCHAPYGEAEWALHERCLAKAGWAVRSLWEVVRDLLVCRAVIKGAWYLLDVREVLSAYRRNPPDLFITRTMHDFNAVCPVRGKRVLELGPLDGCQTASLVDFGAAEVTCVEIRPENYAKLAVAKELNGWSKVKLAFDNFYCVTGGRYGRFDVAVAHGVYYHGESPFTLLRNLTTLADEIFFGGFCATDDSPAVPWMVLADGDGAACRAKPYQESSIFTSGVNDRGFFFSGESLLDWFDSAGFDTRIVYDGPPRIDGIAGRYLRFVARRR